MALLFLDSFDHYTTEAEMQLKWQNTGSANNGIVVGAGRNGLNAAQSQFPAVQNTLVTPQSAIVIGMAYQVPTLGFNNSIMTASGAVTNAALQHVGDGRVFVSFSGQNSGASTFIMFANTWYYIESSFSVVADGTHITLTYIIKVNNLTVLSGTLQITNSTNPAPFTVYTLCSTGGGQSGLVDDFYVTDGEFLGDGVIACLFPRAAGDLAQWTPVAVMPLRTPASTIDAGSALYTNIVGLWPMNEGSGITDKNLFDSSLATFSGANFPTWFTAPASNVMQCLTFPGGSVGPNSSGFLNAGHAATLDHLPINKGTLSIGLKWLTPAIESGLCVKFSGGGAGVVYQINANGSVSFVLGASVTQLQVTTSPAFVPANQWLQLTVTWDGTTGHASDVHIYVNGTEATYVQQINASGLLDETGTDLYIATDYNKQGFLGKMAYFALYKGRILTTVEMATLNTTLPIIQGDATAPNWRYDNEHTPDFNDSYVQTTGVGNKDLYFFDQILGSPTIKGAQLLSLVTKSDGGAASTENILKSGGVEMDGAEYFPSFGSYTYDREAYRKSIFTGLDWTVTEINNMQMGIKRQS